MKRLPALAPSAVRFAAAIAAALSLAAPAQAAINGYTDQAAFLAAVEGVASDSFDSEATFSTPLSLSRTVGAYGYTIGAAGDLFVIANPGLGMDADRWLSTVESSDPIVINAFTGGVAAAGMFLFSTEVFGAVIPAAVTATVTDSLGATFVMNLPSSGASTYVGFVSTGLLRSVTVNSSFVGDDPFVTINNLSLATAPVPEPGSWALLLAGLGVVGALARRRAA